MALLSLADHSIISYGTFGMWGSLLANKGETIMSKDFIKTDFGSQMKNAADVHNISKWTLLNIYIMTFFVRFTNLTTEFYKSIYLFSTYR